MKKSKVGRPRKPDSVKSGDLKKDECRFTFITSKNNVMEIKRCAEEEKLKIKDYLNKILEYYWDRSKAKNENEFKLKVLLRKQNKL